MDQAVSAQGKEIEEQFGRVSERLSRFSASDEAERAQFQLDAAALESLGDMMGRIVRKIGAGEDDIEKESVEAQIHIDVLRRQLGGFSGKEAEQAAQGLERLARRLEDWPDIQIAVSDVPAPPETTAAKAAPEPEPDRIRALQVAEAFRSAETSGRGVAYRSALAALSEVAEDWLPKLESAAGLVKPARQDQLDLAVYALDTVLGVRFYKAAPGPADLIAELLPLEDEPWSEMNKALRGGPQGEPRPPLSPGLCGLIASDLQDADQKAFKRDALFLRAMASEEARRYFTLHLGEVAERAYAGLRAAPEAVALADQLRPWTPPLTPAPPLPEYTRDKPWIGPDGKLADDPLGVVDDARAMADLISLKNPGPPLAIGLFGDWGAGKSSFMEILEKAIRENGELAAEAKDAGGETLPFVENIAHIRFNAWHYAEANLWASLAAHIFRELLQQAGGPNTPKGKQIESLIGGLGVAEEAAAEARQALEAAERAEREARQALAQKEQEIAEAEKAMADAEGADGWASLAVPEDLGATMSALGLGETAPNAERLVELADEARGLGGHLRYFASAFLGGQRPGWGWFALAGAVFVLFAGGALLVGGMGWLDAAIAEAAASLGALIGALGALASLALPHLRTVNEKLGALRSARDDLLKKRRDAETAARQAARDAAVALAEKRAAARAAAIEHAASHEALRRAQALHAGERPGALFMRLIETRAGEDGYAKHLGLVSQLHDDFQLMSDLLIEGRSAGGKTLDEKDRPPIERIVLYIDDLDRCPDETVIKVLEAVHLLLGLPLFVAVVGVDARWLEGALARSYSAQLAAGEVKPEDYLEKIFQLPYQLRAMSLNAGGGFARLVESVMTDPEREARAEAAKAAQARVKIAEDAEQDADDHPEDDLDGPDSGSKKEDSVALDYVAIPAKIEDRVEAQRQIVSLTPKEFEAIDALGPLIAKSPRATKRFMNLYRFEKARRMRVAPEAYDEDYAAAIMLGLAIEVGDLHFRLRDLARFEGMIPITKLASDGQLPARDPIESTLGDYDQMVLDSLREAGDREKEADPRRIEADLAALHRVFSGLSEAYSTKQIKQIWTELRTMDDSPRCAF